ncbi:MAG TPA: hypothetical protein VGM83_22215 [Devosiaceae bacterium]|jgi:ABC-2 type transport system permease protein
MRTFTALIRREFLEHRGAFLYAPLVLTGLLVLGTLLPFLAGHFHAFFDGKYGAGRIYEIGYLMGFGGWWFYLMVTLFFYFANAFSADKRNNSMLFWKSMPVSDVTMLSSKMAAGLTVFPALILCAALFTGIWAYVMALMTASVIPVLGAPSLAAAVGAFTQVTLTGLVFLIVSLLWYAPFFAWVGGLSTIVGRWSMPLAVLIPGVLVLLENGIARSAGAPAGGYIADFLHRRVDFSFGKGAIGDYVLGGLPLNAVQVVGDLLMRVDWVQMIAGWAFAVVVIYVASEYRRRTLD